MEFPKALLETIAFFPSLIALETLVIILRYEVGPTMRTFRFNDHVTVLNRKWLPDYEFSQIFTNDRTRIFLFGVTKAKCETEELFSQWCRNEENRRRWLFIIRLIVTRSDSPISQWCTYEFCFVVWRWILKRNVSAAHRGDPMSALSYASSASARTTQLDCGLKRETFAIEVDASFLSSSHSLWTYNFIILSVYEDKHETPNIRIFAQSEMQGNLSASHSLETLLQQNIFGSRLFSATICCCCLSCSNNSQSQTV